MALGLRSYRPLITGTTHMASTGHYLATSAAFRILEEGGNATDAGVAAGLTLNVVLPQYTSLGGVAPIIVHDVASGDIVSISGLGRWPQAATVDYFNRNHDGQLPSGVLRTVTPAAADGWLTALRLYGTMTFSQVVTPALEIAEGGFPIPESLHNAFVREAPKLIHDERETIKWPSTVARFFRDGLPLETGDVLVQQDLARTFRRMMEAEQSCNDREAGIRAARDLFYLGDIAEEIVRFIQEEGGLLTMDDLARFHVGVDQPPTINYKGTDVYTCGTWTQGPVTLQALSILEGCDLGSMGHNSPDHLHTLIEALKLAYADRDAFYGDPDFVEVPMKGLLDPAYGALRRQLIDLRRANPEMPQAGDPWAFQGGDSVNGHANGKYRRPEPVAGRMEADTSYICTVDRWGNAFSATPSDGIGGSPVIPGLGFVVSARGSQNWLDPGHPACLAPGKRPRLTPNPAMAFRGGELWMPFGTPAGDVQCQSMTQMFLNMVEFGMDVQQAVEAPRVSTWSFPNSFWPHAYYPGLVGAEGRISEDTVEELRSRGHDVDVWNDWTPRMGALCGIEIDRERGGLSAGADLRRDGYAMGR